MIMGKLPTSGEIYLRSSIVDWEPLIVGDVTEFHSKAIISIQKNERTEIDILIKEIYPPGSMLTETFINVTSIDEEVADGLQNSFEMFKNYLGEDMWMFKAFILDSKIRIPIFMVFFPKIKKTFYATLISKNESHFFSNHSLN